MILARLFPGLTEELVSDGAIAADVPAENLRFQRGGYRVRFATGRKSLLMSRPFLEGHIRRRVRALPNVTVLEEHSVTGPLSGVKFVIIEPTPGRERSIGAMFRMEDERWIVTLGGWLGEPAPADEAGFIEFARNLPAPDIHEVIKDAEPLGEAVKYNFPANLRRRYELLRRLPEGYLVTGDALCSFNPIYGQGMSVAALEAATLEECLIEGHDELPRRFYRRVSKVIDTPWKLASGADFAHPGVTGNRALTTGFINWYIGHLQRAATRDEQVCRALVGVTGLLAPPSTLFRPRIAWRVLWQALARRKGSEQAAPGHPAPEAGSHEVGAARG